MEFLITVYFSIGIILISWIEIDRRLGGYEPKQIASPIDFMAAVLVVLAWPVAFKQEPIEYKSRTWVLEVSC